MTDFDIVFSEPGPVLVRPGRAYADKLIMDGNTLLRVYADIHWYEPTGVYVGVADISGKYQGRELRIKHVKIMPIQWPTTESVRQCVASGEFYYSGRPCVLNITMTDHGDGADDLDALSWSVVTRQKVDLGNGNMDYKILAAGSAAMPVTVDTPLYSGIIGGR